MGTHMLNYTERLPSRSPGIPDIFLPHHVLQSIDQLHFEVCLHTPRIQVWMTCTMDHQLRLDMQSSPNHRLLQTATWHWVTIFTPPQGTLIWSRSRGPVTNVDEVTPHWLTVISQPQEESSPVQDFLLSCTVILDYIGRYPVHHMGNYCIQIITPSVLELPLLSLEGS